MKKKKDFSKNSFFANVVEIQSIRLCELKTGYTHAKKNLHTPRKNLYYKMKIIIFLLLVVVVVLRLQFYGHFKR